MSTRPPARWCSCATRRSSAAHARPSTARRSWRSAVGPAWRTSSRAGSRACPDAGGRVTLPPGNRSMILPTDAPTRAQVERLLAAREPASVSIYLPTSPASRGDAERIELKNLAAEAARQLREAGTARADVSAIEEELADLVDDDEFWRHQARSLAVFVTPAGAATFRLPNQLVAMVEVSDRFHLKPLLRTLTFPHTAFVLALSQSGVRLLEIAPELDPTEIRVPDMPKDVASAVGKSSINDRAPSGRLQGTRARRPACASTRARSTRRCGRCWAGSTCR